MKYYCYTCMTLIRLAKSAEKHAERYKNHDVRAIGIKHKE